MTIKVPEGCIKKASSLGLREAVLSYYKLKTVCQHGYFEFGKGVRVASITLGVSERTVRRWFNRLVSVGFMYRDNNGYGLVKYDTVFKILGFDVGKHKRKNRFGSFKIFKIDNTNDILTAVAKEEIALNQRRQEYMIKRKLTQISKPDELVDTKRGVSLSCAGLANLLGYTRSTGHRIEKKLLEAYPKSVFIDKHVEVLEVCSDLIKSPRTTGTGYYRSNGILFRTLPNKIYIH